MVNKEMKFLPNGDIRYEIVDETARSDIQTINTVLDTKADTSNVTALDTRMTGVEDDCYNSYAVGTASGTVASFTDGADDLPIKSLMVDINPVQDLHGYDSPWVAGGGKNKIPYPYYSQAGTLDGVTYTIGDNGKLTATGTTERGTNFFFVRNMVLTAGTYTASVSGDFVGPTFMIYDQVNKVTICNILPAESTHYKTFTIESDKTVNIYLNTSQTGLTFNVSAYFQLEQGSTATAYAPYENICPISGWTGVDVYDDSLYGGNIEWNQLIRNGNFSEGTEYFSSNNCSLSASGGVLTVTANAGTTNKNFSVYANTPIYSAVGHKYFYSFWVKVSTTSVGAQFAFTPLANNGLMTNALTANVDTHIQGIKECTTSAKARMYWYPWGSSTYDTTGTEYAQVHDVVLIDLTEMFGAGNEPSTVEEFKALFPNDYYPYNTGEKTTVSAVNGKPYTHVSIPFGQTVYGGKLDVISGVLTIEKATVILNGIGVNWAYSEDSITGRCRCYTTTFSSNIKPSSTIISDRLVSDDSSRAFPLPWCVTSNVYSTVLIGVDERISSATDFNSWLLENPITLCYELRTPITIQLTPHEVRSLLGQNNIFANTGDIDVEYKADTTLYIERLIQSNVDRAEEAKIDAQNSATQAGQSATNAQTSAQTASSKASEASTSASQALTYKTDTESARDEVQSIVNSISANVNQIDTNTENIASLEEDRYKPYVTDSASGAIASFSDGADDLPLKSLVVNIDPVQDLHGYDSPWVAGGGKNKAIPLTTTATIHSVAITCSSESETITLTGTATDNGGRGVHLTPNITLPAGTYILSITGTHVGNFSVSKSDDSVFISNENYSFTLSEETTVYIGANVINGTTYNETVKVQLESGTTATQWTPYENICPISGWEEMTVNKTGVNLFGGLPLAQSIYDVAYETTAKIDTENHTVEFTRGAQHEDGSYRGIIFDKFKSGKQYTFIFSASQNTAGTNNSIRIVYSDGSTYAVGIKGTDKTIYKYTTPVGKSVAYIALDYFGSTLTTLYCDECGIFEGVVSVDDFEPYNGQTIPISWQTEAGTVYGGHLDVLTGVLTVDRAMVDLGALSWAYSATNKIFSSGAPNKKPSITEGIMSQYVNGLWWSGWANKDYVWCGNLNNNGVVVKDTRFTDAATFKSAMSGVQFCYKLAKPIEIQLDAHTVKSLYGQNNIWADTGNSAVEYRADTKLYIERLTAPDSADMIADSNIVSGQYFMVSNALYKATTNIANGGQIIVGTNCTKVSLATALNEINA